MENKAMETRVENVEINIDNHAEHDKPHENILYDFSSWQSIGSGQESDVEDNINPDLLIEPSVKGYDPTIDERLPETVSILTTKAGSKLYLVGTAHFSLASQEDVAKVIQAVQPHRVIVELCEARLRALLCDEETIMNESKSLNFQKVCELIQKSDLYTGLMHVLMLNVNAYLVKEFGMAPGGEFRRAFLEARKVPNCIVGFGDRPFYITLRRTLGMLSWWQKLKMGFSLLTPPKVTEEELENLKRRDFVDQVLAEIGAKYPEITEVFVNERDLFLTHSLQLACKPVPTPNGLMPVRVVGVVGMGHTSGIMKHWGKVKKSQIPPILSIPPPSKAGKVIKFVVKSAVISAVAYLGYRLVGSPSLPSVETIKSSVMGLVKVNKT